MRENISEKHNLVYFKTVKLANNIISHKKIPCVVRERQTMGSNSHDTSKKGK